MGYSIVIRIDSPSIQFRLGARHLCISETNPRPIRKRERTHFMSATGCFIWAARSAAALGLLLGPSCPALPQQAQQPGPPSLPQAPLPQSQLAQPAIPGLPAPPAVLSGLTWDQVKAKFEAANPVSEVRPGERGRNEGRRDHSVSAAQPAIHHDARTAQRLRRTTAAGSRSRAQTLSPNVSYLHERDHKRELRLQSAQEGTQIASSQHEDLDAHHAVHPALGFCADA